MDFFGQITKLSRQLYPTGRAFKMPFAGSFDKLTNALARSENRLVDDCFSILSDILPDNADFTADDASDWEVRLGLVTNPALTLDQRKTAIKRKMNYPGGIPARQNWRYLQGQLQAAGFPVYVYENRFSDGMGGYVTQNPLTVTGGVGTNLSRHGGFRHGQRRHGAKYGKIVVNSLDNNVDLQFDLGSNLRSTFFIGGPTFGSFVNIIASREVEFRELILKIKPRQTAAFLLVNYV